jgi:hypothetical protein
MLRRNLTGKKSAKFKEMHKSKVDGSRLLA